jgi:hypothetical protein
MRLPATGRPGLFTRLVALASLLGVAAVCVVQALVLADLQAFELVPLWQLLGPSGCALIILFDVALIVLAWRIVAWWRGTATPARRLTTGILVVAAPLAAYVLQYVLIETPPTVRMALAWSEAPERIALPEYAEKDFGAFSLVTSGTGASTELRTLYERIRINAPASFGRHPLGATIDKHAAKYSIDPVFLFFRAYLNSYYGEATSGPVPFLRSMTAETIRDIVQIHVPAWFIESPLRRYLITSTFFPDIAGESLGFKLRYAVHKANIDVSTQPYDLNTFSDTFLVLKEYPEEFEDILGDAPKDELRKALAGSFRALGDSALVVPYGEPYRQEPYDEAYYDTQRESLKRFARAAYYLTALDFDFATKVQALLSSYQRDVYIRHIGAERWDALPRWQKLVMYAMVRDLYTPNVGRLGYNLYALPELNCTPVEYVAAEAALDPNVPGAAQAKVWLPRSPESLWAGAGYQLTVLNEVWAMLGQPPIPGITVNDTAAAARGIVGLSQP